MERWGDGIRGRIEGRKSMVKESKIYILNTDGNRGPSCEMCVCIIGER